MKKFSNLPTDLVYESMLGFGAAHAGLVSVHLDPMFVTRRNPNPDKVALISGGGSGHEPLHCGYVGVGMLDAACPGQVFTSPTPNQMLAAAKALDSRAGVLFIVKNYAGDVLNFQMAMDMMDTEFASVLVNDDVAVELGGHGPGRRGVAGTLVVEKVVGAAAERGDTLAACKHLGDQVNARTASMGVAFTSCTVPEAGVATFEIGPDEMEIGVGIHGEPGRRRAPFKPAANIVEELMGAILKDLGPQPAGQEVLLLVNGLGGTPLMELYLLHHLAGEHLRGAGLAPVRSLVGNYTTSLEMAGASLTVTLLNAEIKSLWDAPVVTPALRW
jgi:dihydroxyacetone kinase-like protein